MSGEREPGRDPSDRSPSDRTRSDRPQSGQQSPSERSQRRGPPRRGQPDRGPPGGGPPNPQPGPGPSDRESAGGLLGDPRWTIAKRDLSALRREKTIVLALLIQLFIAAFSSFLVVGLTSLYDPGAVESGGIVVGVAGDHQDALLAAAREQEGIAAVSFSDAESAREAYRNGEVHAAMIARDDGARIDVQVIAPQSSVRTTLIVDQVRSLLERVERSERIARAEHLERSVLPVPEPVEASQYFGFTYTVLVPLLLFLPPFISGSVAVDALTEEIERDTLELLRVAPLSLVDIVDGKALAMILIAPLQAALWIGLMRLNGIAVSHVPQLLVVVTAFAAMVVVVGLLLGIVTGRRRQAQLLYSLLVLFGFGVLTLLPEHPATTVAKLAVDSATATTTLHVAGYAVAAALALAGARALIARTDVEALS